MSETSRATVSSLSASVRDRMEKQQSEIEETTKHALGKLEAHLKHIVNAAAITIERDTQRALRRSWYKPLLVGLMLSTGIFGGSWAAMQYFAAQVMTLQRTIDTLKTQGGKIQLTHCQGRLCAQIEESAPEYTNGYRVLKGY